MSSYILGIALIALFVWVTLTTFADGRRYRYTPLYLQSFGYLLLALGAAGAYFGIPIMRDSGTRLFLQMVGLGLGVGIPWRYRKDMETRGIKTRGVSWKPRS